MTPLGIGVRCWTGWIPDGDIPTDLLRRIEPRCRIAVITDGPEPGLDEKGIMNLWWLIKYEDNGDMCAATSDVLFPIDDWDEDLNRREGVNTDEPKEVCCD